MTYLVIISVLLVALYAGAAIWNERKLPESISAMVYGLSRPWQWVWIVWMWAVGLTACIPLIASLPEGAEGLGFATLASLAFCGAMPISDSSVNRRTHTVFGVLAGLFSQVCVAIISPWWLMAWCAVIVLPYCDRRWYMPGLPMWLVRSRVFVVEAICTTALFGALFTNCIK